MSNEKIQEGFAVFAHDGDKQLGAVRRVGDGKLDIYIENSGDFEVPVSAVKEVTDDKVVLDTGKLDGKLREAIRRAHSGEDPRI
jgi:hypothetical protein